MKLVRLLILEDDLLTLSKLLGKLSELEEKLIKEKQTEFSIVVLSEYKQVEKYINNDPEPEFDIILLDRDCKIGGNFHTLDIKKFGVDKIFGISSVLEYNNELKNLGVKSIVHKNYKKLDEFATLLTNMIEDKL